MNNTENTSGSQQLNLGKIIEGRTFHIPLYQRAYKWGIAECKKLAEDLCNACKNQNEKSLGLITLKENDGKSYDVIDGQQRFITLAIIGCLLGDTTLIDKITFDRDNVRERKNVILDILTFTQTQGFTDGVRISRNAQAIHEIFSKNKINNNSPLNWGFIEDKCFMLQSVVENDPLIEFMNLNAYKTPFSVCDHVRANLITLNTFYKNALEENESNLAYALGGSSYKTAVSKLYEEVVRLLYKVNQKPGKYESIYDVVKENLMDVSKTKESRINIVFNQLLSEKKQGYRCNSITKNADGWIKELIWLGYIKNLLKQLDSDLDHGEFYTAKLIDNYCGKDKDFFSLISKDVKVENQKLNELTRLLESKTSIDNIIFKQTVPDDSKNPNLFLESISSKNENKEISKSYYSANIEKISEDDILDDIHGTAKYLIHRFLEEQQAQRDATISLCPILNFEDTENPKFDNNGCFSQNPDECIVGELFGHTIQIPVIQRDYCMGSTIFTKKSDDFLQFILDAFEKQEKTELSTIIIAISTIIIAKGKSNVIYIFDGQQRTYTLYCLLEYLDEKNLSGYEFIGRDVKTDISNAPANYIEESKKNLIDAFKKRCENLDKQKFLEFIKNQLFFKYKIISEISSAEQFFMDINGGIQLENYEIFKSCLIENIQYSQNDGEKESFAKKIENEWLKFFYKFTYKIYGKLSETSEEELIEMRVLELICRFLYKQQTTVKQQSFDLIARKSELISATKYLKNIKASDIFQIMDRIITLMGGNELQNDNELIAFNSIEYTADSHQNSRTVGYTRLTRKLQETDIPFLINYFIRSCSEKGRKCYFKDKHETAIDYYDNDLILTAILYSFLNNGEYCYNGNDYKNTESSVTSPIYILAGYNNWIKTKGVQVTKRFDEITEKELPIYYNNCFWKEEKSIETYYNLYQVYEKACKQENTKKDHVMLFLVKNNILHFDEKVNSLSSPFSLINQGICQHGGATVTLNNKEQLCFTKSSAYCIKLKQGDSSILDKQDCW